jgi:hypothetical protein
MDNPEKWQHRRNKNKKTKTTSQYVMFELGNDTNVLAR